MKKLQLQKCASIVLACVVSITSIFNLRGQVDKAAEDVKKCISKVTSLEKNNIDVAAKGFNTVSKGTKTRSLT